MKQELSVQFSRIIRLGQFCNKFMLPQIDVFNDQTAQLKESIKILTSADPLENISSRYKLIAFEQTFNFPPLLELDFRSHLMTILKSLPKPEAISAVSLDPLAALKQSADDWSARIFDLNRQKKIDADYGRQLLYDINNSSQ